MKNDGIIKTEGPLWNSIRLRGRCCCRAISRYFQDEWFRRVNSPIHIYTHASIHTYHILKAISARTRECNNATRDAYTHSRAKSLVHARVFCVYLRARAALCAVKGWWWVIFFAHARNMRCQGLQGYALFSRAAAHAFFSFLSCSL